MTHNAWAASDFFSGANGGTRYIESQTINADGSLTFKVKTRRADGTIKYRDFTVTENADGTHSVSGRSKRAFKDWLISQAKPQYVLTTLTKNEIAFNAFHADKGETASYTDPGADSLDWVGITERLGIEVDYSATGTEKPPVVQAPSIIQFGQASQSFEHSSYEVEEIRNRFDLIVRPSFEGDVYESLNVEGLRQAHIDGWTGLGVKVANRDSAAGQHDDRSRDAILAIAPEAEFTHLNLNDYGAEFNLEQFDVINHSYGITNHYGLHHGGFSALVEKAVREAPNALHTWAAGNNSGYRNIDAGVPATGCEMVGDGYLRGFTVDSCTGFKDIVEKGQLDLLDNVIIVGHDRIGSMRAGGLKDHYIVADQRHLDYASGGTSLAAPKVAGVAALVKHKFPTLGPKEIKKVILDGAIDLGAPGVDEVFGHGMLSVTGALSPRGDIF